MINRIYTYSTMQKSTLIENGFDRNHKISALYRFFVLAVIITGILYVGVIQFYHLRQVSVIERFYCSCSSTNYCSSCVWSLRCESYILRNPKPEL